MAQETINSEPQRLTGTSLNQFYPSRPSTPTESYSEARKNASQTLKLTLLQ